MNDGGDKKSFNTLCTNLCLISLQLFPIGIDLILIKFEFNLHVVLFNTFSQMEFNFL